MSISKRNKKARRGIRKVVAAAIVPGLGCENATTSGTVLSGLDVWVAELLNGANRSGEVVHVRSTSSGQYRNCVESSYIPQRNVMQLVHTDGSVVHIQADSYNGRHTVHMAGNGEYWGEYYSPVSAGDIHVRYENRIVYETRNGRVQQVIRPVRYVLACNGWSIS
jgi:hypothetical protein